MTDAQISSRENTVSDYLQVASYGFGFLVTGAYNYWSLGIASTDLASWHALNTKLEPAISFISGFVPIVDRAHDLVMAAGLPDRAALVRHVYAMDWLICLALSVLAVPGLLATFRRMSARSNIKKAPDVCASTPTPSAGKALIVVSVLALLPLWESWLGSFGPGTSVYVNHVDWKDGDFYRLCIFLPLTLMFGHAFLTIGYGYYFSIMAGKKAN